MTNNSANQYNLQQQPFLETGQCVAKGTHTNVSDKNSPQQLVQQKLQSNVNAKNCNTGNRGLETGSNTKQRDRDIHEQQMHQTMESIQEISLTDDRSSNLKGSESRKSPTAHNTTTMGTTTNVRTMHWVQNISGTQKEPINVTLNQSCQEIPSQTFMESPNSTGATRADNQVCNDEFQNSVSKSDTNTTLRIEK